MKKKKIIIIILVLVVLSVGFISLVYRGAGSTGYIFETVAVEKGSVEVTITATGTLEATNTVIVGTQVSGVIENLYVDFNSIVSRGQLIAELDKSTLISSLETAEAELAKSQASYEYQASNLKRMEALKEKNMLAESDYDLALYNYKTSKAGVKSAQANVDRSSRNLSYAMIYSPIDGVVINRAVEEGQTVAASMNTPELFTITNDLSTMQVEADVDEADIGQVKEGQRVEFTVDAFPDETFSGKVSEVRLQPVESSNVVTYTVIVLVSNPELKLKPGMTASITVFIKEASDVLVLAGKALRFEPEREMIRSWMENLPEGQRPGPPSGGGEFRNSGKSSLTRPTGTRPEMGENQKRVWIKNDQDIRPVIIETGINDGSLIEICSGLDEGDQVIISMAEATRETSDQEKQEEQEEDKKSPFVQERPKGGPPRR